MHEAYKHYEKLENDYYHQSSNNKLESNHPCCYKFKNNKFLRLSHRWKQIKTARFLKTPQDSISYPLWVPFKRPINYQTSSVRP